MTIQNIPSQGRWGLTFRLSVAFAGIAAILITVMLLALYLSAQLGDAVNQMTQTTIPLTRAALGLSERSATLAASTPALAGSRTTEELATHSRHLDGLFTQINTAMLRLDHQSHPQALAAIRANVGDLAQILQNLKRLTAQRLMFEQREDAALKQIHATHSDLQDTLAPVVYGVTSINNLFGKRLARHFSNDMRQLIDQELSHIYALLDLQLVAHDTTTSASAQQLDSLRDRITRLKDIRPPQDQSPRPVNPEIHALFDQIDGASGESVITQLPHAIKQAKDHLDKHFAEDLAKAQSAISAFMEQSVRELGQALDIKAEGNLLFALLSTAAQTEDIDALADLQARFNRAQIIFSDATRSFLDSTLAQRNPILAGNVARIQQRTSTFGHDGDGLFSLHTQILSDQNATRKWLTEGRLIAQQLAEHVNQLLADVEIQTSALRTAMSSQRQTNEGLLVAISLGGLLLAAMISVVTLRILKRHEHELSQAAAILESTNEGVMVTDAAGHILSTNPAFTETTGYTADEVRGKKPSILGSGRHDKAFYIAMWQRLTEAGHWQGELYNRRKTGEIYPEWLTISAVKNATGHTTHYAGVFSDISVIKHSQQRLDHLAHHDALTGLPNRLLLTDRLEKAIQHAERIQGQLAVIFLDLDRFKNINDTLGHSVGDRFLQAIGRRLLEQVRGEDTVARLGGDEFMVVLEALNEPDAAGLVARKLLNAITQPVAIDQHQLVVTASIGISFYPSDGVNVETLVRNADTAMYRAKDRGKNNYQYYSAELTAQAITRFAMEEKLRNALEREEFALHYQPQYVLPGKTIVGVEALLRWHHPQDGLLAPDAFLQIIEEIGMMEPLVAWVLRTACCQWRSWVDAGLPAIRMAVNISGTQLNSDSLIKTVSTIMAECRIDPGYLEMEITEGSVLQNPTRASEILQALRNMGVTLAIDDFGTGYSSLSYLKRLPIHKLKIDRSFIQDIPDDPDDVAITRAVIALAKALHLEVIAEGVENERQQHFLIAEGCNMVQGYYYSHALPDVEIAAQLKEQAARG